MNPPEPPIMVEISILREAQAMVKMQGDELTRLREVNRRLNRRAQSAERAARENLEACQRSSTNLGRGLANWAYNDLKRRMSEVINPPPPPMRNISFHLTQPQILARTKTVTRRVGWLWLVEHMARPNAPEILLQPIVKGQGIPKGGHVQKIGGPIRILDARREMLDEVIVSPEYGALECEAEGFPNLTPTEFVHFFCKTHPATVPTSEITRIQFEYLG